MRISDWSSDVCSSDLLRLANVKEVLTGIGDLPLHREVDVDDVLVARQHQALFRNIATRGAGTLAAGALEADVDLLHRGDAGGERRLDRPGQVPVETRLCGLDPFAEAQHDALLVGLHPVEAGKQPHDDDAEADQQVGGLAKPAATARQDAAEAVLAPLDEVLEVGRTRSAA